MYLCRNERLMFKEKTVRKLIWFMLLGFAQIQSGAFSTEVLAQATEVPAQEKDGSGAQTEALLLQRPRKAQTGRYLVTYMNSDAVSSGIHAATVVTVTNLAGRACNVSVRWFRGVRPGRICTTNLNALASNRTVEFCSRNLPIPVTQCNSTCSPEITFGEGRAVVASSKASARCARLGVSARVYYSSDISNSEIQAITDSRVLRLRAGRSK